MDDKARIKKVYDFIKIHDLAVISTVTKDFLPESAVIGFSEKENLELVFGTFRTSRKYQNILSNPRVALAIGWEKGKTVQYEGTAEEISEADLAEELRLHLAKLPSAAKYISKSEQIYIKIKPKWLRYSDLSVDPWDTLEIRF